MVIKAIKPGIAGIRPAIKPAAIKPAVAAPVVDEALEAEVLETAAAEEVVEVAAPAVKPVVKAAAKPAAAAPKAAAKPAAAPKAAAPKAEAEVAAPKAKKIAVVIGEKPRKFEVQLPGELGGRITLDNVQELFYQYMLSHAEQYGMEVHNKVGTSNILDLVFQFLVGDSADAAIEGTVESIVNNGGLAVLFEAKLREGVHFKHTVIGDRKYRNPRSDSADNAYVRVQGRRSIGMSLQIDPGTTTYEAE
jgi:hypothetical protein